MYVYALSKSLPQLTQKYPSCQNSPRGYLFLKSGHNINKILAESPFIICINFASLIVRGQSTIKCACSFNTFKIMISILYRLHASSIETLQNINHYFESVE